MHAAFDEASVANGIVRVDLGAIDLGDDAADWSNRDIPASDIVGWLLDHANCRRITISGVHIIHGAADGERFDLSDVTLDVGLSFRDCVIDPVVNLDRASLGQLTFQRCDIRGGLSADNATLHGGLAITEATHIGTAARGVSVAGDSLTLHGDVEITGDGTLLDGALRLLGATIGGRVHVASGARVGRNGDGDAIYADGAIVQGLFVEGPYTRLGGGLRLIGATIDGQLRVRGGARIAANATGRSMIADSATVRRGVFISDEHTCLDGEIRLLGASINGQLAVRGGARIDAKATGRALDADNITVDRGLFINGEGTRLGGGLRLNSATINGELNVGGGAHIVADAAGRALDADNITVNQDLLVHDEGTCLDGEIRLVGADINGQLTVKGGRVTRGVNLARATIATLSVSNSGIISGELELTNATIRRLQGPPDAWDNVKGGWALGGVTINAIAELAADESRWTVDDHTDWLMKDKSRSRSPYTQIAARYRDAGHHVDARRIAIAGEKATSSLFRRVWAGLTIGYGYRPWRAGIIAFAFVLAAFALTSCPAAEGLFIPTNPTTAATTMPWLDRLAYTTETVIPVVDFGQRNAWQIDRSAPYGLLAQAVQYMLDLFGWALGLLIVAAVTGLVRRE